MAYTEVTTNSYGSRVKNAFGGIFTGIIMFIAGTVLLWWNEGNVVKEHAALNEMADVTVEMQDINKVAPDFEGKVIHATGEAITNDILADDQYPVKGNFTRLRRTVEYYQYVENKHEERRDKLGGGEEVVTTYTYERKWVDEPVNSGSFHDPQYQGVNGVLIEVPDAEWTAAVVNFGAYKIPDMFKGSIGTWTPCPLEGQEGVTAAAQDTTAKPMTADDSIAALREALAAAQRAASAPKTKATDYQKSGNVVYYGSDMTTPHIGDVRITFEKVDPKNPVSVLAKVQGDSFAKYVAKNGKQKAFLYNGTVTAEEMYQSEHDSADMMKWLLRLLGFILVFAGLKGIFNFLTIILKVVPFLASIMNFGVNLVCGVIAFVWTLIIIAIAWLFYRPVLGICILAVAAGLLFYFATKGRNKQPAPEVQPVGPQGPQGPQGGMPQQQFMGQPQQPQQFQQPQYPQQGQPQYPQQGRPQYPQQGQPQYPQQGQPQYPQQPYQGQRPQGPNNTPRR